MKPLIAVTQVVAINLSLSGLVVHTEDSTVRLLLAELNLMIAEIMHMFEALVENFACVVLVKDARHTEDKQ
jgi:hypothetical protein